MHHDGALLHFIIIFCPTAQYNMTQYRSSVFKQGQHATPVSCTVICNTFSNSIILIIPVSHKTVEEWSSEKKNWWAWDKYCQDDELVSPRTISPFRVRTRNQETGSSSWQLSPKEGGYPRWRKAMQHAEVQKSLQEYARVLWRRTGLLHTKETRNKTFITKQLKICDIQ